jgi:hypothetical protein
MRTSALLLIRIDGLRAAVLRGMHFHALQRLIYSIVAL